MPLAKEIKDAVYLYCNNHLADEAWYNEEFELKMNLCVRGLLKNSKE